MFAGAFDRYGLCAYTWEGELIWQRRDLKKVQTLVSGSFTGPHMQLGVHCEMGPFHLLEPDSGEAEFDLPGVKEVFPGPSHFLAESNTGSRLYRQGAEEVVWERPCDPLGYGLYECAITASHFAYAERFSKTVRGHLLDGTPVWSWTPPPNYHVRRIQWDTAYQVWRLIEGSPHAPLTLTLVTLAGYGRERSRMRLEDAVEVDFMDEGRYLVSSAGTVLECESGEVVWRFAG